MNEQILDTFANLGITLAAFSGVVVAFRSNRANSWSKAELRVLWLMIVDSFLVAFFALLPVPMAIAGWSAEATWNICNGLLGGWFILGSVVAVVGEVRDHVAGRRVVIPVITQVLFGVEVLALIAGIVLWLSLGDVVPGGQALFVTGLIVLLAFAAIEFLFFIGLTARQNPTGTERS